VVAFLFRCREASRKLNQGVGFGSEFLLKKDFDGTGGWFGVLPLDKRRA